MAREEPVDGLEQPALLLPRVDEKAILSAATAGIFEQSGRIFMEVKERPRLPV
jgi:hypothetical protein